MALEFFNILTVILLALITFPLIFLIYRGFPKNKYSKKVYNKIPSNDPPALINSLFGRRISKTGEINIGSFYLTLLDLINRNYISVRLISKNEKIASEGNNKDMPQAKTDFENIKALDKVILKINKQNIDKLHPFERNVLKCLDTLEYQGNIDILNTKDLLYKRLKVNTFQKNYDEWIKNFYHEFFENNDLNMFNNRMQKISRIYGLSLIIIFVFSSMFFYLDSFYLNLVFGTLIGILGLPFALNIPNSIGWNKEAKKLRVRWDLFKKYYNKDFKKPNLSQEFLDNGINHIPYLLAMGVPKSILLSTFAQTTNITDVYLFVKYGKYSIIRNIVRDFLAADGTFDPKYYNTSGNFVPGYGL
jgi:uncharacterized membrane protein